MDLRNIPQKHPYLWTCGCLAVVSFPQWFQSVWSLFRADAPIPVIRQWLAGQNMTLPTFSPYWITVPLGLLMFFWLMWELRVTRKMMGKGDTLSAIATVGPSPRLDVSEWTDHGSYFVWVAACLWVNIKPVPKIDENSPAYPSLQKIKGALSAGLIQSIDGTTNMRARVSREELKKLASIAGESPKFLFPG